MEKIVIVGGGGHAKSLINIIQKTKKFKILGYVDLKDCGRVLGVNYLGEDSVLKSLKAKHKKISAAIGVGYVQVSDRRQKIYERLVAMGFKFPSIVSPTAIINQEVKISEGTVVFDAAVINVGSTIGTCSIINTNSSIDHDCTVGNFVHIAPGAVLSGGVVVGDFSLISTGAKIIQYKTVAQECLVGAGAVVVNDCTIPGGKYLGIPAVG